MDTLRIGDLEGSRRGASGEGLHKYQAHVAGLVFRCAPNQPQMRALGEDHGFKFKNYL